MARNSTLRAVTPDDSAQPMKSLSQAADEGSQLELLVAMRARVARAVEDPKTPAHALAPLTRRLLEIAREIDAAESRRGGDEIGTAAATPDATFSAETL